MSQKTAEFDVIIIGGGPGGLSAAFWCAELGLNALLLERKAEFGGQLLRTFKAIKNHLGADAANGREMRDQFLRQVENTNAMLLCGDEVAAADLTEKTVVLADGTRYSARAIIIATGVSRRKLNVPGEAEFYGKGILESGEKSKNDVIDKRVLIVGGGDAAIENALILSRAAKKIFVVHRRSKFSAWDEFVERASRDEKIEFIFNSTVTAIIGNEKAEAVEVEYTLTGARLSIPVDAVLIRVGVAPNTGLFRGQIDMDDAGFIRVDCNGETRLTHVFAIGDVANPLAPTISGAVGGGANAAKIIATNIS